MTLYQVGTQYNGLIRKVLILASLISSFVHVFLEGGSVCSQLYQVPMNHKTVLEIPVVSVQHSKMWVWLTNSPFLFVSLDDARYLTVCLKPKTI